MQTRQLRQHSFVIVEEITFLCLRLPFGTTPAPAEHMNVGEAAIDLGNDLLRYESWDTYDLKLPHQYLLPEEEKKMSARNIATLDPLNWTPQPQRHQWMDSSTTSSQ